MASVNSKYFTKNGTLDTKYITSQLNKASSASAARKILSDVMGGLTTSTLMDNVLTGNKFTKNLENNKKAVTSLLQQYGKTYKTDVSALVKNWNSVKNAKGMTSVLNSTLDNFNNYFTNGYQPNHYNGQRLKEAGDTVTMADGRTQNVWKTPDGTRYVWIGDGNRGGKYVTKAEFDAKYAPKAADTASSGSYSYAPSYSDGGGDYSVPDSTGGENYAAMQNQVAQAPKIDWLNKDIDEMAGILGLETYKTEDILKSYNEATNKKFDELDTQVKRTQAENLRALEGNYDTYLNTVRENRANAISNGMTKGAAAAEQLAAMYANAQTVSESQQKYYDNQYDIAQERATALEENVNKARQDRLDIEKYLGELRSTYDASSVNELAARLAASSQVYDARAAADAQIKSAGISANAERAAANVGYRTNGYTSSELTDYEMIQKMYDGDQAARAYIEMKYGKSK